jgi:heat-inducible transcriptional repressor
VARVGTGALPLIEVKHVARRRDRPAGPLDARAQAILRTIIEDYVATAQPVGSQALVERYGIGVSSATVRSIMADLERAGLLSHPHTSAGRTPTDAGYRYYIESISEAVSLAPVEQLMIRHQFGQVEDASEQWFRLAAATLATATQEAGLATSAKPATARLRHLDLVAGRDRTISLVLVLAEGSVKQTLLVAEQAFNQGVLDRITARLAAELAGASTHVVETRVARMPEATAEDRLLRQAALRALRLMQESDATKVEEVYSDGLLNVIGAPEFAQGEKLRRVFAVLQDRSFLGLLVDRMARRRDVQVFIGSENGTAEMEDVSLVVASYGRPGRAVGIVGVLGPTRMPYPHAISTVRFVSGLMNELVDHLYA